MSEQLPKDDIRYFNPPLWTLAKTSLLVPNGMPGAIPHLARRPDGSERVLFFFREQSQVELFGMSTGMFDCTAIPVPHRERLIGLVTDCIKMGFTTVIVDARAGVNDGWEYPIADYLARVQAMGDPE